MSSDADAMNMGNAPHPSKHERLLSKVIDNAYNWIVAIVIILAIAVIGAAIWKLMSGDLSLLQKLSGAEYARGLITFIFAITTVAVALILLVFLSGEFTESTAKKFALGKEVLTVLIGVFGTILGFYFGTAATETLAGPAFTVAPPVVTDVSSERATITTFVSGGQEPYTYMFLFDLDDPSLDSVGGKTKDGLIRQAITFKALKAETRIKYRIVVTDGRNRVTSLEAPRDSEIVIPAASAPPPGAPAPPAS